MRNSVVNTTQTFLRNNNLNLFSGSASSNKNTTKSDLENSEDASEEADSQASSDVLDELVTTVTKDFFDRISSRLETI